MEINFDLLVAGCNTHCKHCYVRGGPGPMMAVEDALRCIEKLDELAACLPEGTTFTLDNEPMNHPHLDRILRAAANTRHIKNHHHGMTTGIGLLQRADKADVVQAYRENGYHNFGLTLHGIGHHHDEITRRNGAFDALMETAKFLKAQGAKIEVSLMLNRFFAEDREQITHVLEEIGPDVVFAAIPIFTPHRNMLDFEPYRATRQTFEALRGYLSRWRQEEDAFLEMAWQNTVSTVRAQFRQKPDLPARFAQPQNEMYLTVHADRMLYVGNTGAETRCLGDLRTLDVRETAATISALPGNRDYGAFYETTALPGADEISKALDLLPEDLVYGDQESVFYRALVQLGVPTLLLET